jgi:hypothetical protein
MTSLTAILALLAAIDWSELWTWLLAVGLGSFFLLVLVVLPLGARDIFRMFRRLDGPDRDRRE